MIKVEQEKKDFTPIKITLGTADAVRVLYNLASDNCDEFNIGTVEYEVLSELVEELGKMDF